LTDEPNRRLARLNEQFRREITAILRRSVRDPRTTDVVVNSVQVTPDLWLARVFVGVRGEDAERAEAFRGLDAAANFIRRELSGVLHIRRIPELRFLEDKTLAQANRIEEILRGLNGGGDEEDDQASDTKDPGEDGTEESGGR
jgi:ribosome-binding factor A